MVGCLEILEYILYTADTCLSLGTLVVQITNMNPKYSPAVWLAFYVSAVTVYSIGGKFFWRVSNILAFLSITILLVYCFGCLKFVDFKYAEYVSYTVLVHNDTAAMINSKSSISLTESMQSKSYNNLELLDITNLSHFWFHGGFIQFMRMLPLTGWFYIGIESLNFASNDVSNVSTFQCCLYPSIFLFLLFNHEILFVGIYFYVLAYLYCVIINHDDVTSFRL